jgi:hypothetical protein
MRTPGIEGYRIKIDMALGTLIAERRVRERNFAGAEMWRRDGFTAAPQINCVENCDQECDKGQTPLPNEDRISLLVIIELNTLSSRFAGSASRH